LDYSYVTNSRKLISAIARYGEKHQEFWHWCDSNKAIHTSRQMEISFCLWWSFRPLDKCGILKVQIKWWYYTQRET